MHINIYIRVYISPVAPRLLPLQFILHHRSRELRWGPADRHPFIYTYKYIYTCIYISPVAPRLLPLQFILHHRSREFWWGPADRHPAVGDGMRQRARGCAVQREGGGGGLREGTPWSPLVGSGRVVLWGRVRVNP